MMRRRIRNKELRRGFWELICCPARGRSQSRWIGFSLTRISGRSGGSSRKRKKRMTGRTEKATSIVNKMRKRERRKRKRKRKKREMRRTQKRRVRKMVRRVRTTKRSKLTANMKLKLLMRTNSTKKANRKVRRKSR
jgi:hypothetical protein